MNPISKELAWRGLLNQMTFSDPTLLDEGPRKVYLGIDPTADSLHVGHLAIMMMLRHLLDAGWGIYLLVGGGTGMIGDPSGKSEERNMLTLDEIERNKRAIGRQMYALFEGKEFEMVDNYDWLSKVSLLDFLRDAGKHFGMSMLVQRDYIAQRIGEGGAGMSYTEFSYTLLQGYDFWHLFKHEGVTVQIGGSDQWGNMLSGVDLIRKKENAEAHVLSGPIVMNKATGKKFGKSEAGAVWLDPDKTSPFKFYQFWLNSDDESVIDYLKYFTLLNEKAVSDLAEKTKQQPEQREAQKTLAYLITSMVHGKNKADSIVRITETLFGSSDFSSLEAEDITVLTSELPFHKGEVTSQLSDVLVATGLASSKTEARRYISDGAISINGQKYHTETLEQATPIHGHAIIKRGKNSFAISKIG